MNTTIAIREMLRVWNTLEAAAKAQFPEATEEQIYQITSSAMNDQMTRKAKG